MNNEPSTPSPPAEPSAPPPSSLQRRRTSHPLWELTLSRLREFWREPSAIFWTFVFPVLLAVGLGIAFRHRPAESFRLALVGNSDKVRQLASFVAKEKKLLRKRLSRAEALAALRQGKIDLILYVTEQPTKRPGATTSPASKKTASQKSPRETTAQKTSRETAAAKKSPGAKKTAAPGPSSRSASAMRPQKRLLLTYHYDPLRPTSRLARLVVDDLLQRHLGRVDRALVREKTTSEKGNRYIDFLIPGLVGLNVMSSSMWGIGYAIVLARRRRLLKRLAATPMRREHFLLAFMFSRLIFLVLEVVALLLVGWLVFDVVIRGSFTGVALCSLVGSMAFMGVGLAIASRPDNTEVAAGWMNAVMLPMWLLSGSFFSYERFPEGVHPLIRLLPLTAFNDAFRALINEGAPLWQTLPQLGVLLLWGLAGFLFALKLFRWQ